eukprot:jgi/Tetstr1/457056/TSEL_043719.t1
MLLSLLYPSAEIENQQLRRFKHFYDVKPHEIVASLSDIGIGNPVKRAVFERDAKCIYLINPMGGGKSKFALAHIKSQTCGERSIFFTSRQALAKDVAAKAKDGNVNLVNYLDYNLKCEKKLEAFVKRRGVIMQQESLHHLFGQQTYDYVFIDEFESFLNQWASDTHKHLHRGWTTFMQILQDARNVYALDALPSKKSLRFLKSSGIDYKIISSPHTAATRAIRYHDTQRGAVDAQVTKYIVDNLEKHEKLFGYYPYINPSGRHKSIIEIAETACKLAGKNPKADAVLHHGKMDLKAKTNIMADVNRTWLVPLVMCNSAVTCGVSFTKKWFTKSFIAKASWNNPRDLVQFSFRVRNLGGDNTIDIFQLGEPAIIPGCDDIMSFKEVERRINARDATTVMQLSMEKFYFEVMFKPCTPKGSIAALWDNGKHNFVKTLYKYLQGKGRQSGRVVVPDLAKRVEEYMEAMIEGDRPSFPTPPSNEESKRLKAWTLRDCFESGQSTPMKRLAVACESFFGSQIFKYENKDHKGGKREGDACRGVYHAATEIAIVG